MHLMRGFHRPTKHADKGYSRLRKNYQSDLFGRLINIICLFIVLLSLTDWLKLTYLVG